jgi:Fur family iron response transcriptional regulator
MDAHLASWVKASAALQPGDRAESGGCPVSAVRERLKVAGLRPTRQRILLGWLLFAKGHRHVSAEDLYAEATRARAALSLATVYNTLRQFSEAGLLRQVHVGSGKAYFDTYTGSHHHFVVEDEDLVFDVPDEGVAIGSVPAAPPGFRVVGVDVVVRLARIEPDAERA